MNSESNPFKHMALASLACLLAVSCDDATDNGSLPDGKYPVTLTASVDGQTVSRVTTDNTWTGGEEVAIQINGTTKKYTAANDGSLTIASGGTPFYWTNQTMKVNAWYPYNGGNKPADNELTVKANQSENNNFQESDYLEAVDETVTFGTPAELTFKHRTAKVVVTLKAGEGVTDVANAAVTFVNQTGVDGGGTEVTPKTETIDVATTYSALLIPQDMQGKQFIKVTVGGNTYYYTPTGTDADLKAGKQYTYTITVKKTGLEVTVTGNGSTWNDTQITTTPDATVTFHITAPTYGITIEASGSGGTLTGSDGSYTLSGGNTVSITGHRISIKGLYEVAGDGITYTLKSDLLIEIEYTLADAQVGDFYCKSDDGSTGYLIPGDIPSLTDAQQAACIGIVYSTDTSRIGAAATQALKEKGVSTPHGLVMALTNASDSCLWGEYDKDENSGGSKGEPFKENSDQLKKQYKNVDGYGETHWMFDKLTTGEYNADTYKAFDVASKYGTLETAIYAAPSNTTGWFIPSIGQWWDISSNLGEINLTNFQNGTDSYFSRYGYAGSVINNTNKYLQKISGATQFSMNNTFWSSSEYRNDTACGVVFNNYLTFGPGFKENRNDRYFGVRCSFAF